MGHMEQRLDLDAVRLLSLWLSARGEVTAHLDLLTAFGPNAAEQVARNIALLDSLQEQSHAAWRDYRAYVLSQAGEGAPRAAD